MITLLGLTIFTNKEIDKLMDDFGDACYRCEEFGAEAAENLKLYREVLESNKKLESEIGILRSTIDRLESIVQDKETECEVVNRRNRVSNSRVWTLQELLREVNSSIEIPDCKYDYDYDP